MVSTASRRVASSETVAHWYVDSNRSLTLGSIAIPPESDADSGILYHLSAGSQSHVLRIGRDFQEQETLSLVWRNAWKEKLSQYNLDVQNRATRVMKVPVPKLRLGTRNTEYYGTISGRF